MLLPAQLCSVSKISLIPETTLFNLLATCQLSVLSHTDIKHLALKCFFSWLTDCLDFDTVEESDIIDLEKRYWLLKAQSRTGRFDLETFGPLVSPPIHPSLSEGMKNTWVFLVVSGVGLYMPVSA